ncbi:MAG TPA: hypothetical protein VH307_09595 [Streptosporangiaceae bacterium]|jgi:hypothetical protein|nr:hypothetical protein [Streptosporangiaceae bacterium]
MPGAQDRWDQLAEPSMRSQEAPTQLDSPRIADRPERGSLADLRLRLERLPAGHPSSPYNDDLSRKPPVARLKDLELPLQGNGGDTNGAAKQYEPEMAEDAPAFEGAETARYNGTGGRNHAGDGLIMGDQGSTPDRSTATDGSTASDGSTATDGSSTADWSSAITRPSSSERVSTDGRLGADNGRGTGGRPGTGDGISPDEGTDADDGLSADDGSALPWSGNDDLNVADDSAGATNGVTATDWTSADDKVSAAEEPGSTRWSSTDDLSNTAEWSRTSGWNSTRDRDGSTRDREGSTRDWEGSANHDAAAKPAWLEPAHPIEADSHAAADAVRNRRSDEARTGLDGSWEWNGRYLTPAECHIAEEALNRCRTAEGRNVFGSYGHSGLTPAMRRLEAQLERGQLVPDTERNALKAPDLFKERLADLIQRHPDKSAEELSHEVHDGISYVYLFEAEHYADATLQVHSRLKGQGFELEARRNSWRNPEYKGINTRWRDPAHDIVFEVQFHTASSWDARQRTDASRQRIMDPATSPAERRRLRATQAEMSAGIPAPPRCTAIPDYRKEAL